jgi:two-component system chemotaxis response regulator CheB
MSAAFDAVVADEGIAGEIQVAPAVVGIAASAGGLAAIEAVLESLPEDFPVPIVIVQHVDPTRKSQLVEILGKHTLLNVRAAANLEKVARGTVYVAPSDHHVTLNNHRQLLLSSTTPQVHFVRPSADVLFESLANKYAGAAIVIVLTGTGADGASGAAAIKENGGRVIVQDPKTAAFPGMPSAAIAACHADYVLDLPDVAPTLCELVGAG